MPRVKRLSKKAWKDMCLELYLKHGDDVDAWAQDLNQRGIAPPKREEDKRGKWGRMAVRGCLRIYLDVVKRELEAKGNDEVSSEKISTEEALEPQESIERPTPAVDRKEALNALVDLYRSGKLTELLDWYETTKGEVILVRAPERRPLFRGAAKNTGIKISGEIMERALGKARSERHKVGGSLSKLVEYLLWCYIGSPSGLIEGND